MGKIFDGVKFANKKTEELKRAVQRFEEKNGRRPKLVTIYDPNNQAGRIYTNIKEKKAGEIGVLFEKYSIDEFRYQIDNLVPMLNSDKSVDGIMVQVPLFEAEENGRAKELQLISMIDPKKDVDGLREESGYVPAVVRAVLEILKFSFSSLQFSVSDPTNQFLSKSVTVLGSKGFVGSRLMEQLHKLDVSMLSGMDSDNLDLEILLQADVVISATGVQGLFSPDMVKDGVCLIDIGYPQGDFDPIVAAKTSFYTPVPGGVGPVTVVSLFANLLNEV